MRHFSSQEWIDFARQVADARQADLMQKHLSTGCSKCLNDLEIWRSVAQLGRQEARSNPPEWAVRAAATSFRLRKVVPFCNGKIELARLFSDSALQPLAAGVRGSVAYRQLLYKSGSIWIDMHMQPKPGSDSMVLTGQLLDATPPSRGISGVPVSLLREGGAVLWDRTNDFGEFDFGTDALHHLQLVFGMPENKTIIVPVPDGESEPEADKHL